jgi:hypothetical protein
MQLKLGHESHTYLSMKFDVNLLLSLEIMQSGNFFILKTMQRSNTLELHTKTSQG